jgi:hypothetical protein
MLADGVAVELTPNIMQIVGSRRSVTNRGVRAGVCDFQPSEKSL